MIEKILILDGISGIPLGKEICGNFKVHGISAIHFDCLKQQERPFYDIRSAYAKFKNKQEQHDGFYFLPTLEAPPLETLLSRERPSHILVIGFAYKFYDPAFLKRLANKFGIHLFLYDTDSCNLYPKRREFIFFIENELPIYDRIFSFSKVTTRFFQETRSLDTEHLPFGAQPLQIPQVDKEDIDVLFVGTCDLRRIFLLEDIRNHVAVRGNRWQRNFPLISKELQSRIIDKPIWGKELYDLLARAKIVLNITRTDFFGVETGINLRLFEALAAGRFLLTDYCDEINDLFDVGKEIEVFRSSAELADKVGFYLKNDDKRLAIARRGHDKFLKSHTWRARTEKLTSYMNISI